MNGASPDPDTKVTAGFQKQTSEVLKTSEVCLYLYTPTTTWGKSCMAAWIASTG